MGLSDVTSLATLLRLSHKTTLHLTHTIGIAKVGIKGYITTKILGTRTTIDLIFQQKLLPEDGHFNFTIHPRQVQHPESCILCGRGFLIFQILFAWHKLELNHFQIHIFPFFLFFTQNKPCFNLVLLHLFFPQRRCLLLCSLDSPLGGEQFHRKVLHLYRACSWTLQQLGLCQDGEQAGGGGGPKALGDCNCD